jgi:hypothetical protein
MNWIEKAKNVARFGDTASSGERASYEGLPMLYSALQRLSALDQPHKQAVAEIVQEWVYGNTNYLWDIVSEMRHVHEVISSDKYLMTKRDEDV